MIKSAEVPLQAPTKDTIAKREKEVADFRRSRLICPECSLRSNGRVHAQRHRARCGAPEFPVVLLCPDCGIAKPVHTYVKHMCVQVPRPGRSPGKGNRNKNAKRAASAQHSKAQDTDGAGQPGQDTGEPSTGRKRARPPESQLPPLVPDPKRRKQGRPKRMTAEGPGTDVKIDDISGYPGYGTIYSEGEKGHDGPAMTKGHVPRKDTQKARAEAMEALKEGLRKRPKCGTISLPCASDNYADKHRKACGAPEGPKKVTCIKCMRAIMLGFFPSHKCIEW